MELCGLLAAGLVAVLLQHFWELRYALYLAEAQAKGVTARSLLPANTVDLASNYQIIQKKKNHMLIMVIAWRLCRKEQLILLSLTQPKKSSNLAYQQYCL